MLKISWIDKLTNENVFDTKNLQRTHVIEYHEEKQLKFEGHVLKKGKLENLILTGKIEMNQR